MVKINSFVSMFQCLSLQKCELQADQFQFENCILPFERNVTHTVFIYQVEAYGVGSLLCRELLSSDFST